MPIVTIRNLTRHWNTQKKLLIYIYSSKRYENQEVFEMYYYEAYQLKATILMDIDVSNGKTPDIPLSMMEECMKWSNSHLINDYVDRFNGVSGKILQSYKNK